MERQRILGKKWTARLQIALSEMVLKKKREHFKDDLKNGTKLTYNELRGLDSVLKKDFIKFTIAKDKDISKSLAIGLENN